MYPPLMETYKRYPIAIAKGKGSFVWDQNGKKYLDFTSGIAVCNLGHVPERVKAEVEKQLEQVWHTSNLFHIPVQEELARKLTELSFADQVFFCNSGTEANEGAIKLARRYAQMIVERKGDIVTFIHSFHGRTFGSLSATAQLRLQQGFEPLLPGFRYLPFNDPDSLRHIEEMPPVAVMLELVQGEGGVIPVDPHWLKELYSILQRKGILLIIDEVQTGMGRTGRLFAYQEYGIEPDILTLAKGLGSGFPIGAILAKGEVARAFIPGSHGSTFGGNPLAMAAGLATLKELSQEEFLIEVRRKAVWLIDGLRRLQEKYPSITVRGKGLLLGIEMKDEVSEAVSLAREKGLLLLFAGPKVIRILPPLTVSDDEMDQFLLIMDEVLETATAMQQGV